jgi:LuxR family maltose regulon positive regulatory protein
LTDSIALAGPDRLLPFVFVPRRDLIELIAAVPAAAKLLSDEVMARLPDIFPAEVTVIELTGQEQAVLTGLADGKSTTELAAEMHLSEGTVKSHRRNLYRKLGVSSRSAAVIAAAELGLLSGAPTA